MQGNLTEQQCKELYETWQLVYGTYGDRGSAHLVWLNTDPDRLDEVANYVAKLPVPEPREGFTVDETAYVQQCEAKILWGLADEIRQEREPSFDWGS